MVPGPHFEKLCSKIEEYFNKLVIHALPVKLPVKLPVLDQVLSMLRGLSVTGVPPTPTPPRAPRSLRRGWFKEIDVDLDALCSGDVRV